MPAENIVIVGGGIVGLMTAYYTAINPLRGDASVTIVEGTDVAAGASGKAGGLLAEDWHGAATESLSILSYRLHANLAKEFDGETHWGYRKLDTLSVTTDARPKKLSTKAAAVPWMPQGTTVSSRVLGTPKTTSQVHPRLFCRYMLSKFLALPRTSLLLATATALTFSPTTSFPELLAVYTKESPTELETIPCDRLILAAGPWTGELAKELLPSGVGENVNVVGTRAHSIVLKAKQPLTPHALFMDMTLADGKSAEPELYARPDGTAYICGAADDEPLPKSAADVVTSSSSITTLHVQTHAISPIFKAAEIVAEQACFLPVSDRGRPYLGKVPGVEGVYVGSANSCWGITQGPGMGMCLSELLLEGSVKSADVSRLSV